MSADDLEERVEGGAALVAEMGRAGEVEQLDDGRWSLPCAR